MNTIERFKNGRKEFWAGSYYRGENNRVIVFQPNRWHPDIAEACFVDDDVRDQVAGGVNE